MRLCTQSAPHRFTVWEHSLRALEAADTPSARSSSCWRLTTLGRRLLFAEPMGSGLTRREVWKLAVLLHDVAKPDTRSLEPDGRTRFTGARPARRRAGSRRLPRGSVGRAAPARRWPGSSASTSGRCTSGCSRRSAAAPATGSIAMSARRSPVLVRLTIADAAGTDGRAPGRRLPGGTRALLESFLEGERPASEEAAAPPLVRGEDVMAALRASIGTGRGARPPASPRGSGARARTHARRGARLARPRAGGAFSGCVRGRPLGADRVGRADRGGAGNGARDVVDK